MYAVLLQHLHKIYKNGIVQNSAQRYNE